MQRKKLLRMEKRSGNKYKADCNVVKKHEEKTIACARKEALKILMEEMEVDKSSTTASI